MEGIKEKVKSFFNPRSQQEKEQRNRYLIDVGTFVTVTGAFIFFRK